jgi:hypothetical protein
VVAFNHRPYSHLDCRRCDELSKVRMASVDPTDLNPLGAEIIHVIGFVCGSMPLPKRRMRVKSDVISNVVFWHETDEPNRPDDVGYSGCRVSLTSPN